ncbi:MAG: bifunctional diguanylate cyclase/phosphodiesterase [Panacagrimonas sp.]
MSLSKQLWLAIVVVMTLAFGGTFAVSTVAARHYFEQQLFVKNVDNATALALSMSQMGKDLVALELLLSAQFDAGHYRSIRLTGPTGTVLIERRNDSAVNGVPPWFVSAVPLRVMPGIAQVQDGWKQFGTVALESHDQYAYAELWSVTLRQLGWFTLASLGVGLVGSALLRPILRPLTAVVEQAEAIGDRRFIVQPEPRTLEFRQVVRSMNTLSNRVRQIVQDESQRVEQLRQQAQLDPLTGLRNRETFMAALDEALGGDEAHASGVVVILRVAGLAELNRAIGREAVDQLLRRVAEQLKVTAAAQPVLWTVARLGSCDFVVLAPGADDARAVANPMWSQAQMALDRPDSDRETSVWAGCASYRRGDTRAAILARVDGALIQGERSGTSVAMADPPASSSRLPADLAAWRSALDIAVNTHGLRLGHFPVMGVDGNLLHYESPLRLRIGDEWLPAAQFIAWAARLGQMPMLDALVVEVALQKIALHDTAVSVNVSAEAICDPDFASTVARHVSRVPGLAPRLWLEVPEYGALRHLPAFRKFCQMLKPLGCKLGLKQGGLNFSRIWELHDLGLDTLKLDGTIVRSLSEGKAHPLFLRSLCVVAHTIGLKAIAVGVSREDDLPVLAELGLDGFTGPAVRVTG